MPDFDLGTAWVKVERSTPRLSWSCKTCVTKGASIWTNLAQKAAATHDAIAFLDRTFGV